MLLRSSVCLLVLTGCPSSQPILGGTPVWEMLPFDGQRTWEYTSTDLELPYRLVASSVLEPEKKGDKNIYSVEYWTDCAGADPECVTGEVLRRVKWSSDVLDGIFIHAYDDGNGYIDLDPPLHFAEKEMLRDEAVETETAGALWTSTFRGIEECPIKLTASWPECGKMELTVSDGDGYPLAGSYWLTAGNGTASLQLATEEGQWQLSSVDCEGECDGTW
jgi:hypothetical protein